MERVNIYGVEKAIPLRRETERRARCTQVVSQGEEAPGILTGYLEPFSGGRLLTPEEELDLGRRTMAGGACPDTSDRGVDREQACQPQYNSEQRLRGRLVPERCLRDTSCQRIRDEGRNML
jgi:hypothetical protein